MDQTSKEPTFEESIKQVMQTLPTPVRNYLGQGKYSVVAKNLMAKYELRVDQGSILEREIMLILMGIEDQNEFASSLKNEALISDDAVRNIMTDINQEIFVPLREQMRSVAGNTQPMQSAEPIKPVLPRNEPSFTNPTPANPRFPRSAIVPNISMSPRTQPSSAQSYSVARQVNASMPRYSNLENKTVPTTPHVVPNNGLAAALKQVLHEEKQVPVNPNEKLLEDHEEPHIEFNKTSVPPNLPGVIQPGARFSPIAHEVKPSPIIPKTEPLAPSIPPELPKPIPPVIPPVAPVTPTPPTHSRPYSTDPYREPIDEK